MLRKHQLRRQLAIESGQQNVINQCIQRILVFREFILATVEFFRQLINRSRDDLVGCSGICDGTRRNERGCRQYRQS